MPIYRLPPFRMEAVFAALAETIDWGLANHKIPDAWKETQGEGVTVAVLDTGLDLSHPDLTGAVAGYRNFTDRGGREDVADRQGHGTHVSGTIGARRNQTGVVGVAPLAKILAGKVLGDDGAGYDEWIAAGIDWAVEHRADIVSMSLGSPDDSPQIEAAVRRAVAAGRFVICAAGNSGRQGVDSPGRMDEVVAVAAVDRNGRLASFSSVGPQVDIAAPGEDVLSCWPGGKFAKLSGTSMATPFVAGVAALMVAKQRASGATPLTNNAELLAHLRQTATDAGPVGFDPGYGWGLINPSSILAAFAPPAPPPVAVPGPALEGARWPIDLENGSAWDLVFVPRSKKITIG